MKFLHTADCHLDSPLRGLEQYEGCPAERIRQSTRDAFENIVSLAIDEAVDFVIIAGDLFDGQWTNQQTALWAAKQFRHLQKSGIEVFLIRGNHDAMSESRQTITWPDNVHEFPVEAAGTRQLDKLGVALHGRGFAEREINVDLAIDYPQAIPGLFNIGILHTSLGGDPRHDAYAPTSEKVLADKGYDYWALGHIHTYRQVRQQPRIVYCGCPQGRHINETGAKGCVVCTVDERGNITEQFHETDVLRWAAIEVDLEGTTDTFDISTSVQRQLNQLVERHAPRLVAVRVTLMGSTPLHGKLASPAGYAEAVHLIRMAANNLDDLWIEHVEVATLPPLDLERLHAEHSLLSELLNDVTEWREKPDADVVALADHLQPLAARAGVALTEGGIDLDDAENLRKWLQQAESLLLAGLTEELQQASP